MFGFAFGVLIGGQGATGEGGTAPPSQWFPARNSAILFQGHSLVDDKLMHAFRSNNLEADVEADIQQTIIVGAPSWYIWDHSAEAKGVDSRAYLQTPSVDVFVYAEGGPLDASGGNESSPNLPFSSGLNWAMEAWNNGTWPLLYAIWPYTNTGTPEYTAEFPADPWNDMTDWRAKIDVLRTQYARIVGYVDYHKPATGEPPFRLVPADALMAELYDTALAGNLIGVGATEEDFFATVFTDNIHLTLYGWYAIACLHYACIYGLSPDTFTLDWVNDYEIPYGPMPTGPQAAQLQAIAWAVAQADPLGPFGDVVPDYPYAVGGGAGAQWWTPDPAIEITPPTDAPVTSATLAWSYRYAAGQLDSPPTPRLFTSDEFSFVEVAGGDDETGRGIGSQLVNSSWTPITLDVQGGNTNFMLPGETYNFLLLISSAGSLSGGMTAQLWSNGTLVRGTTSALSNVQMHGLMMFGDRDGVNANPGETQGWWWSNDSLPADVTAFFEAFFDSENGLRTHDGNPGVIILGITPDEFQIGPPVQ